jgi:D-3-phosphoglycerate dehydrogenase
LTAEIRTGLTEDQLLAVIADYHGLVVRSETKVTRKILQAAVNLKIIGRAGVGVDNIDVEAATERGIVVVNSPEGNTVAAAEHTLAMMLALARNLPQANSLLKAGIWERKRFTGVELRHKILGILGLGKIGKEVARKALGMDMRVLAYDPYVSWEQAQHIGVELTDFDLLIRGSDFITVHLPLTKDTYHLLGQSEFAKMKSGARVVNVARGGIVDEAALFLALQAGKLAGAAIDVFEHEPITQSPLFGLDNVVVTPHLGASTEEAQVHVAVDVARDMVRALQGGIVSNPVNIPAIKPELRQALDPFLGLCEKLGKFTGQLVSDHIQQIEIKYNGEMAKYDLTSLTNTLLKGLLRPALQEAVNYVNAPYVAKSRGIRVYESKSMELEDYVNLITIAVKTDKCEKHVSGTLFRNNQPRIVRFDGYTVDAVPEGQILVIPHIDRPRLIGPVGTLIGDHGVNIAGMQVGRRERGGKAVMFLTVDSTISPALLGKIRGIEGVLDVRYVEL